MDADFTYRFDRYEISPRLRQIRRDGEPAEAQPKTFDLLLYLVANRDRVVDRDELLNALWPGLVVSESALTQVVRKARTLVGDDGSRQSVIRTVQRRGFRFVAPVETVPHECGRDAVTQSAPSDPSIAVLPFVDMSLDHSQEYFCDGMTEEITNELAGIPNLRVAARTSAFAFKNRPDDVRNIARQLGVGFVLEGSVRRQDERLRVTAQLIDASTGFHLWSERWDRRIEDMLAIQDEIANRIAVALRRQHVARPETPAAFTVDELCERGFGYLHRFGRRSQRFAMDLFHQALAVEPRSARAWAGLALSSFVLYRAGAEEHREEAWQAADRAIELDANSAAAWTARGAALALLGRHEEARAAFERAIAEDESLFEAWFYYGHASIENGRYGRAAELYEHASQLRPDDYQALVFARQAYRSLGDQGRERDAALRQIPIAERALTRNPTDARALSLTAGSLIVVGRTDEALTWSRRACALEPDEPYVHYNAACTLALLGETERALEELEHGTEESVLCRPSWVERDDDLASLRHHPRFRTLLDTLRGPASATDSAKKSVPPVDSPDDTPILNIRPLTN